MDGRANNGGARNGAGRKPKSDEIELIEKLKPLDDLAFNVLSELLEERDQQALKLFMAYRFGQPNSKVDFTSDGESIILNAFRAKENEKMNGAAVNGELNGKGH